jgi:Tol biopolymer transport system component
MKTKFKLTTFIFIICLFFSLQSAFSQKTTDARKVESNGYFVHPENTVAGVVATDNYSSKIYLVQSNGLKTLISSPGCGRYFTVSPDRSKIGFKLISADGMQVPAIYDLTTGSISKMANTVKLCGQPSFSNTGKVAYTTGNTLNVLDSNGVQTFDLGVYSNITPISPDGNYVIFNNDNDQLFLVELSTSSVQQITDDNGGYAYPQWSPDGNKVSYSSLSGNILVWDKTTGKTYTIGKGENVSWSDDSRYIIYNRTDVENFVYKGSDIYIASFDGSTVQNITNTADVNEIAPSFGPNNTIIYSTFDLQEIISATFDWQNLLIKNKSVLVKYTSQLYLDKSNSHSLTRVNNAGLSKVMVPGNVPYINQVYDVPSWDDGYCSCAPTSAAMALAYYNRLPYWPITLNEGNAWDPHISNYGSYIADEYTYNTTFYDLEAVTCTGYNDCWGGHGYMWNGSNSPATMMAPYIQNHNVTSVYSGDSSFSSVKTEINNGYPMAICNTLSADGHLTLAVGYVLGQHTLIFNDPYGDKDTLTWPNYYGKNSYYDWPGYSNGFQNLNTVPWTVTAEASQLTYSDTVIDDVNYNHGFYIYNKGVALMRYYHDSETGGIGNFNHYWWTYTTNSTTIDTCYVKWTPALPSTANYEVYAYIPSSGASATAARYKVYYDGGNQTVVINQSTHAGQWVSLGTFPFLQNDTNGYVRLGDAAGVEGQELVWDAVKFSYAGVITSVNNITKNNVDISIGPNPATNVCYIDFENIMNAELSLKIMNIIGQTVLNKTIAVNANEQTLPLDISDFAKGIYFAQINSADNSINKCIKFVKQ